MRVDEDVWGAVVAVGRHSTAVPAGAESRLEQFAELVSGWPSWRPTRVSCWPPGPARDPLTGLANHRAFHGGCAPR
ncbi:MAG: hypothetical protein U0Y82_05515 [Thermoleophilia bacterium]